MKFPKLRFNLRTLMVAVAIFALMNVVYLAIRRMRQSSADFHRRGEKEAFWEYLARDNVQKDEELTASFRRWANVKWKMSKEAKAKGLRPVFEEDARRWHEAWARQNKILGMRRAQVLYHGAMKHKYFHLARYPWLPVVSDPPEPQPPPE